MFRLNIFIMLFMLLCVSEVFTKDHWRHAHNMTQYRMLYQSTFIKGRNTVVHTGGCCRKTIDVFFASNGSIVPHGNMSYEREEHTADLLPNGLVFIVGPQIACSDYKPDNDTCVADLYDPQSGKVKQKIPMKDCRWRHTSSLIHINHSTKVLLVGGSGGNEVASGEVYDVKNESFYRVNNSMPQARMYHAATTLPSGDVIIAGGCRNDGICMDDMVLYNNSLNLFIPLEARLPQPSSPTATYIPSIKSILLVCGTLFGLFDVPTLRFVANGTTLQNRQEHTATLLLDGRVLIAGGIENYGSTSCEIYDPTTNKFTQAANMSTGRYWHTATLIPTTGEVLVCGGRNSEGLFNSCEIYIP